jgi:hypothetical protein
MIIIAAQHPGTQPCQYVVYFTIMAQISPSLHGVFFTPRRIWLSVGLKFFSRHSSEGYSQ